MLKEKKQNTNLGQEILDGDCSLRNQAIILDFPNLVLTSREGLTLCDIC